MTRRPPRSTLDRSSAASDVYKRQPVDESEIGELKIAAMTAGWPVADGRAIHARADPYRVTATLRPYQREAVSAFLVGGSGLVLLPCGAGKTIVGVAAAPAHGGTTPGLSPSRPAAQHRGWRLCGFSHPPHRCVFSLSFSYPRPTERTRTPVPLSAL